MQPPDTAWAAKGKSTWVLQVGASARKRLHRSSLSPSTAGAVSSCAARWAAERMLPRPSDPFGAAELGTATHALFEDLFHLPKGERDKDAAYQLLSDLLVRHPELPHPVPPDCEQPTTALMRWSREVERRMLGLWEIEDPDAVDVEGTERHLDGISVGGVPFNGYIDRLDRASDGSLLVRDYKCTGRIPNKRFGDKHGDQMRLYTLALKAADPDAKVGAATLYYVIQGKRVEADLSGKAIDRTERAFARSWEKLSSCNESGEFTTHTSALCGWCPLVSTCPAAAAAGKVSRIEPTCQDDVPPAVIPSTHQEGGTDSPPERTVTMTAELKPWEESNHKGELNLGSYAASAAFGTVSLAVSALEDAGIAVKPTSVFALADTFAFIVASAQEALDSPVSMQTSLNTRLRGALRTALRSFPIPFGEGEEAWEEWAAVVTRRVISIAKAAITLWATGGQTSNPWAPLVGMKPASQERPRVVRLAPVADDELAEG